MNAPRSLYTSGLRSSWMVPFYLIVFLLALTFTNISQPVVLAIVGDLDPTFGSGGKVITNFGGYGALGCALVVQNDGKIIAAGYSSSVGIYWAEDFAMARYNPDGSLDPTFGSGGKLTTDFFGDQDEIRDVTVQLDHKIVAVGFARSGATFYTAVVRYNPDGSLDSSFGEGGKVLILPPGNDGQGNAVVIQPDNKIVVAGRATSDLTNVNFGVWRLNPDGSLDPTFGSNGFVNTDLFGGFDFASGLVRQPDGKLVVAGSESHDNTQGNFALVRYNSDGSLDKTFGSSGIVSTDFFGQYDFVYAFFLQSDGKLVLAGGAEKLISPGGLATVYFSLARYNPNGTLDPTFGTGGKVTSDLFGPPSPFCAVGVQPSGKLISIGNAGRDLALVQFNSDGSLDSSFGSGGKLISPIGIPISTYELIIQSDGKIDVLGTSQGNFALARYEGEAFDLCLQDESNGNLLQLNTTTGEYQFSNCAGLTIGGTGTMTRRGNSMTLQQASGDRRVTATIDIGTKKASATIQLLSQGRTFSITDKNITNNNCACK